MIPNGIDGADRLVWYGAIGSMMNRRALKLRGIQPCESLACIILDYRRVFYAPAGMATLWPAAGHVVQAVLHSVTPKDLALLEAREPPSHKFMARVQTSRPAEERGGIPEGTFVEALVSIATWGTDEALPTARYLDIMLEGARDARMCDDAVQALASTPTLPRPDPAAYRKFPIRDGVRELKYFRQKELQGKSNYAVFRGKVLYFGPVDSTHSRAFPRFDFRGVDMTLWMARQYYNPEFGHPDNNVNNGNYWAWLEDHAATTLLAGFQQVGYVEAEGHPGGAPDQKLSRGKPKL